MMEQRKNQFLSFILILLSVGFLQYFRKIINRTLVDKVSKILYLATMIVFSISSMVVLYLSGLKEVTCFLIGLFITTMAEHIAKLFLTIGDNLPKILSKIIKHKFLIDIKKELEDINDEKKSQ